MQCAGNILGGGIGPGLQSKFRSLKNDTDSLPHIGAKDVIERVKEAVESGNPLPIFATNTQEAMIVDAFQEFAGKGRNVIEAWLEKAYKSSARQKAGTKLNTEHTVLVTGGDGDILQLLLMHDHGRIIEHIDKGAEPKYEVEGSKHLIHYGVTAVLVEQVRLKRNRADFCEAVNADHVGQRVAKMFDVEADDGDNVYRGRVVKVVEAEGGKKEYNIKYDDGDEEDVSLDTLFGK